MPDSAEDNVACRICMDHKDNYVSLFFHDLSKKVIELADVLVEKDDGLPDSICTECEQDLEKCYEFRLKVQFSDKKFRENIRFSQVEIEECNIKEERFIDDGHSDNMDDKDSVSIDDEHYNDEPEVAPKITEETEEAAPDPLNHVVVVEEKERKIEMSDYPISQDEAMTEEPRVQKMEEVAVDPLVCMKEEEETEIMDVDPNQPDPFGPSSSVRSTSQPNPFPILLSTLSSRVDNMKNEMNENQQLGVPSVPSEITEARQQLTMESIQQPNQGFMIIPQTGFNLNSGILIPCVKFTPKTIAMPKSNIHSISDAPFFLNPSCISIQNTTNAVTENNGVNSVSAMTSAATSSHVTNQNDTMPPTVTQENQPKHDAEETEGGKQFFCSVCSVDCGSTELLDEHKSEKKTFICRVCTTIFSNHQELENHFFGHKKFTCESCKKTFHIKSDLQRHKNAVLTCKTAAKIRCKLCNNKFVHKMNFETHMEEKHPTAEPRVLPCLICEKRYKTFAQFSHHMRTEHTAFENVLCDICHKIFPGPIKLKLHIKCSHLQSSEFCPICKKLFGSKYTLNNHMEVHTGKEITCAVCGASVKGKAALGYHMQRHKSRDFPCIICNVVFKTRNARDRHIRKEHKKETPKPAICEVCGKEYKSTQILKNHMVVHSDEKPYVCDVCGAAFKSKVVLRTHGRIHSDLRKYTCNLCGEGFKWKQTFDKHVLKCESSQNEEMNNETESD